MKLTPASGICFLGIISSVLSAREWTSSDGKKLEADFVSSSGDSVTLKRGSDGREFTLPLARLSPADRDWVKEQSSSEKAKAAPSAGSAPIDGTYATLLNGDWATSVRKGLPFVLYGGKNLESVKKYPLVLALHGKSSNNENGKQVGGWMKSFAKDERYKKNPCLIVAPLCYQPYGGSGGGWSDKPGAEAVDLVKDLIKELPIIDKERIYVIGHSMGGFGVCHLMAREPRLFAAGIPVSGCGSTGEAGELKRRSLWLFHAANDETVKVDGSRKFAEALERSKVFKYTEYPDGGHGIVGRVFDDDAVHEWLFAAGKKAGA
ncbi:MAG: alpha/beta fold hydrolase [Verrucomicrobiales bacterium]